MDCILELLTQKISVLATMNNIIHT